MKCPHCGHEKHRVTETRATDAGDRRIRLCRGCGHTFTTMERVTVWFGRNQGWLDVTKEPPPEEAPVPPAPPAVQQEPRVAAARAVRFMPDEVPGDFGVTLEAQPLLLQWWREARRSKWAGRATWTEAAWLSSVRRVGELPPAQQLALCQAGVENGWQALKADYLRAPSPQPQPVTARPMPRDPSMRAALEQWPA